MKQLYRHKQTHDLTQIIARHDGWIWQLPAGMIRPETMPETDLKRDWEPNPEQEVNCPLCGVKMPVSMLTKIGNCGCKD